MIKKSLYLIIFIITIVFFIINNNTNTINIKYENLKVIESRNNINIEETKNGLDYNIVFNTPGEYYLLNFDLVNDSNIDVRINSINNDSLTDRQKKYLEYSIYYDDGRIVKENDIIKAKSKKVLKIAIYFKEDIEIEDLPENNEVVNLNLDVNIMPTD